MSFSKNKIIVTAVVLFTIGLAIGLPFIIQEISSKDRANIILISLLVATAIDASGIALYHLKEIRKQNKLNAFLAILKELAEPETRMNRGLVSLLHNEKCKNPNKYNQDLDAIKNYYHAIPRKYDTTSGKPPEPTEYKYAIEATVSNLDRVGFFLVKYYPELKDEAPEFIWEITTQMWAKTEWFVSYRRQTSKEYGRYFEKLNKVAEER